MRNFTDIKKHILTTITILLTGLLCITIPLGFSNTVYAEADTSNDHVLSQGSGGLDESAPVLSIREDDSGIRLRSKSALPAKYDSRGKGNVTPIRNQGSLNICWSFATISAIESSLLAHGQVTSAQSLDLSERQLAYFSFNLEPDELGNTIGDKNIPVNSGHENYIDNTGNAWLTTNVMASGIGVVNETDAPTCNDLLDKWEKEECVWSESFNNRTKLDSSLARGANSWSLSSSKRIRMKDKNDVKQAIIENGGVAALVFLTLKGWGGKKVYWHYSNAAYFNKGEEEPNHLVTIIGWDDNYSAQNFYDETNVIKRGKPDSDGAWLCKNSWGTSSGGQGGYFWLSYEDCYFKQDNAAAYAFEMRPASTEERLYQYDGAAGERCNTIQSGGSIANMFTSVADGDGDEILKSICLSLQNDVNVDYSIQIYTDCTDEEDPTSGEPALSSPQTGKTTFSGFYTIDLDESVRIKKGSKFSVVLTLSHNDKPIKYDVDADSVEYKVMQFVSAVSPNQSFEKDSPDASWEDLASTSHDEGDEPKCAARIKAITAEENHVHKWGKWTNLNETEHQRVCSANRTHIEKAAHSWDGGKVTKAATYTASGIRTFTCTICEGTKTETIAKLQYPFGQNPNQKAADGTSTGKGASAAAADAAITKSSSEEGPAGSNYAPLQLRSSKQGKNNISLTWNAVSGAKTYVIYGNACGKTNKLKKLATSTGKNYNVKKINNNLKKGTYHKFMVVALDKNNNVVSSSKVIHVATKGSKKIGNPSKVTVKKPKTLKKGKTHKLKGKQVGKKVKKHRGVAYESTNTKVATVSKKGVVKATGKGTCYIYVYAQNGVYKKVKITVK